MTFAPDNNLEKLREAMVRRAGWTEQLVDALARKDGMGVKEASEKVEASSRELSEIHRRLAKTDSAFPPELKRGLEEAVGRIHASEIQIKATLQKLGASSLHQVINRFEPSLVVQDEAEALIKPPWNPADDLVVLIGAKSESLANALYKLGQKRIFVLCHGETPSRSSYARDGVWFHGTTLEALDGASWQLRWPYPGKIRAWAIDEKDGPAAAEASQHLSQTLRAIESFSDTLIKAGETLYARLLTNLDAIVRLPSAQSFRGAGAGMRVLIVPESSVSEFQGALGTQAQAESAVVIAEVGAVDALVSSGVHPHFVLVAGNEPYRLTVESAANSASVWALAAVADPQYFEGIQQSAFTFSSHPPLDAWIYDGLSENASVGGMGSWISTATSLARWLDASSATVLGDAAVARTPGNIVPEGTFTKKRGVEPSYLRRPKATVFRDELIEQATGLYRAAALCQGLLMSSGDRLAPDFVRARNQLRARSEKHPLLSLISATELRRAIEAGRVESPDQLTHLELAFYGAVRRILENLHLVKSGAED